MDERNDYTVLRAYAFREEAEVVACTLRADGIDAFLGDNHHAYTNWGITIALGGLQVLVPAKRLRDAKTAINERLRAAASDLDPAERAARRDRWKVWLVIAFPFVLSVLLYVVGGGVD